MSTATITKLRSGGAVFELGSMTHWFADWRTAVAEAERIGISCTLVDPDAEPQVASVAPSLRVLP